MKTTLILMLFIVSFKTHAETQGVQVYVADEYIDSSTLEKKYEVTRTPNKENKIPNREKREELLREVASVSKCDELDKDIFYMDLEKKSLEALVKKYPGIKEEELKVLQGKRK